MYCFGIEEGDVLLALHVDAAELEHRLGDARLWGLRQVLALYFHFMF